MKSLHSADSFNARKGRKFKKKTKEKDPHHLVPGVCIDKRKLFLKKSLLLIPSSTRVHCVTDCKLPS